MSIRVYSLAKQLQKDNNVIINACNKLGIKSKNKNTKTGAESGLVALSTLSDEDVERIKEYLANETPVKKPSFRNLMEPDNAAPLEPPKPSPVASGKMRRIQPARGRITEVDPNARAVSSTVTGKESTKAEASKATESPETKPASPVPDVPHEGEIAETSASKTRVPEGVSSGISTKVI